MEDSLAQPDTPIPDPILARIVAAWGNVPADVRLALATLAEAHRPPPPISDNLSASQRTLLAAIQRPCGASADELATLLDTSHETIRQHVYRMKLLGHPITMHKRRYFCHGTPANVS